MLTSTPIITATMAMRTNMSTIMATTAMPMSTPTIMAMMAMQGNMNTITVQTAMPMSMSITTPRVRTRNLTSTTTNNLAARADAGTRAILS